MAGANPMSAVGTGYLIVDKKEPDITLVAQGERFHVCVRATPTWKQIVAEFLFEKHAKEFVAMLNIAGDAKAFIKQLRQKELLGPTKAIRRRAS